MHFLINVIEELARKKMVDTGCTLTQAEFIVYVYVSIGLIWCIFISGYALKCLCKIIKINKVYNKKESYLHKK